MPSTTTYYGLHIYNSTTDASETFLDFRTAIAGVTASSNMILIDDALKDIQDQLDVLDARKGIIPIDAAYVSPNYYEATSSDITAYETDQIIALKLDTTSNGTVTLNINALGTKSVMKVDSTGAYVNMDGADLRLNKEYNFKYDGTRWVWMDALSSDQINIEGTALNFARVASDNTLEDSGYAPSDFATAAEGVTNGDSHDHIGGDGNPITEGALSLSDVTTNDASTSKHGFMKKLSSNYDEYINGAGNWVKNEYGGKIVWDGTDAYHIEVGMKKIEGSDLEWTSNISRTGLSLSVDTLYYIYVYDSTGATVEESTTAAVWNSTYKYFQKTGDSTRRFIGAFYTDGSGNIIRFFSTLNGNVLEVFYKDYDEIITAGSSTASWASVDLSSSVPVGATHWFSFLVLTISTGDVVVGISPIDQGSDIAQVGVVTVRSNATLYPGRVWVPIETSQTAYYRTYNVSGSGTAYIRSQGFRFNI